MKEIKKLKGMIVSGINNLYNDYPKIDKLNVFPVPDGDTGTNMNLTCTNGFKEIESENFNSMESLMTKFARGLIMGARGNSGVIFSQIVKGFANGMKNCETLDLNTWKSAFTQATTVSYAAVMKPVEGTILTVIRETSEYVNSISDETIDEKKFWEGVIKAATTSLENTPNLLAQLKEVGVVDSGGYGLVKFLKGMQHFVVKGKSIEKLKKIEENMGGNLDLNLDEDEFGYCTETIVTLNKKFINELQIDSIRDTLDQYKNTSIVAVLDEDILKVHTHALIPGQVLTYLQQFGEFKTIKIENMTLQAEKQVKHHSIEETSETFISKQKQRKLLNDIGTIAVVRSKDMKQYFKDELNIDYVIDGGKKMNPSTKDFLDAIEKVDAKVVYIFPNDSNVILAATQAKIEEKLSKVIVIETKTIPEGVTGYLNFDPSEKPKQNQANIKKAIKSIVSVSINKAVKDTVLDNVQIKEGQYMMTANKKVTIAAKSLKDIFNKSLAKFITSKTEILTIFIGSDASPEDTSYLKKLLDEKFNVEYELVESNQEVYTFIIGIE